MTTFMDGRPAHSFPPRAEPRPKKTRTFRSTAPDGRRLKKAFRDQPVLSNPMALYYQVQGKWVWHAVCDKDCMPDWASNYTQVPASPVSP